MHLDLLEQDTFKTCTLTLVGGPACEAMLDQTHVDEFKMEYSAGNVKVVVSAGGKVRKFRVVRAR